MTLARLPFASENSYMRALLEESPQTHCEAPMSRQQPSLLPHADDCSHERQRRDNEHGRPKQLMFRWHRAPPPADTFVPVSLAELGKYVHET